jgi:hypothetical protein
MSRPNVTTRINTADVGNIASVDQRHRLPRCRSIGTHHLLRESRSVLAAATPVATVTEPAERWACQCGAPVRAPSILLGRSWCTGCETYGVPVRVESALAS